MSAEGALTLLVQMLKEVGKDYIDTKRGAGLQLSELQKELGLLVAHLKNASDMGWKDHAVQEKEKQVRELVYQVEDIIDTYLADKAAEKKKGLFGKIPRMISTTMEVTVRDLRANKVAPALRLLEPPPPPPPNSGSIKASVKPPIQKVNSMSRAGMSDAEASDIESSYKALAHDRRVCLLYTALFPKNYISASTLTELWIAERFISQEDNKTLEETATKLLEDLIAKKLLVAHEMRLNQVKTCRLEDRIRNFCKEKAMEENLFTVIKSEIYAQKSFYRLCFHSDPSAFLSKAHKSTNVRSFLCLVKDDPINLDPQHSSTIPNVFKPLRILKCESTKFDELPKNLTSLKLLKHITLWIDKLDVLPEEISKLSNLQTLIIKTESKFITVKANIWKMEKLRHLKAKVFFVLDDEKWKEGEATNLQTISRLSSKSCSPALSKKAPNLKSLGIQGDVSADHLEKLSLGKFKCLEKLKLVNYKRYGELDQLDRFPSGDRFPLKLKSLTLSNTKLNWNRHMVRLVEIDTLEVLKLKHNAFTGAWWDATSLNPFKNLKLLLIIDNTDLNTWDASPTNFPLLECIVIKECQKLRNVPHSLAKLVKNLLNVPDSLKKQVEDSQKNASQYVEHLQLLQLGLGSMKNTTPAY